MKKNLIIAILIFIIIAVSFALFIREGINQSRIYKLNQTMLEKERDYELTLTNFIVDYWTLYQNYQSFLRKYREQADLLTEKEVNNARLETWQYFKITGYSINDPAQGTTDIVRVGLSLNDPAISKLPIIAVDPAVVPLYSIVEIEGVGAFIALDTGGAIKGKHIEILFDSKKEAKEFGVHENVKVRIIERKSNDKNN